jgi:hypothetical protein
LPAYEATGFGRIDCWTPDMRVPDPSARWQEWQKEDLRTFIMWRPKGRDWRDGVDKAPWKE